MAEIHPAGELTIARETIVKPPPDPKPRTSTQLERIRAALAKEIMAGKVGADQSATTIFIRIGNVVLFPSGGAKVNDSFAPIAAKIAAALDREPGAIHVDGYTDTDPIHTVAFPSNFELSEARAKSVAAMLKPGLSHPERLVVTGKGPGNPVAPNDTEPTNRKTGGSKCRSREPTEEWVRCGEESDLDDRDGLALDRAQHSWGDRPGSGRLAGGAARLHRRRAAVRERARPAPHHRRDPPRGRRRHRLAHHFATPGRRQDRARR